MKFKIFQILALNPEQGEEELNLFCAGRRIVSVEKEFVEEGQSSFWSVFVTYLSEHGVTHTNKSKRVDYREVLDENQFALYVRLRNLRKEMAEKEAVPAFALFTNEQLADMIRMKVQTESDLEKIEGVGPSRVKKYGRAFLNQLKTSSEGKIKTPEP